jgi:hypothetical protein
VLARDDEFEGNGQARKLYLRCRGSYETGGFISGVFASASAVMLDTAVSPSALELDGIGKHGVGDGRKRVARVVLV